MANKSKAKGNAYEREIVKQAQEAGVGALRAWGSNGQSLGLHPEVDGLIGKYKAQMKIRKVLPSYIKPSEHVDIQVIRENRGQSYVVLPYSTFLELIHAPE